MLHGEVHAPYPLLRLAFYTSERPHEGPEHTIDDRRPAVFKRRLRAMCVPLVLLSVQLYVPANGNHQSFPRALRFCVGKGR